jgi:hypothetical protein
MTKDESVGSIWAMAPERGRRRKRSMNRRRDTGELKVEGIKK